MIGQEKERKKAQFKINKIGKRKKSRRRSGGLSPRPQMWSCSIGPPDKWFNVQSLKLAGDTCKW